MRCVTAVARRQVKDGDAMSARIRDKLKGRLGERFRVTATFERWGAKTGFRGRRRRTLLLRDVRLAATGELLTDHLWFTSGLTWERLCLAPGDKVAFDARVTSYEKGYVGARAERKGLAWSEIDYRLTRPTRAELMPGHAPTATIVPG
jgi:hypothetical protein